MPSACQADSNITGDRGRCLMKGVEELCKEVMRSLCGFDKLSAAVQPRGCFSVVYAVSVFYGKMQYFRVN